MGLVKRDKVLKDDKPVNLYHGSLYIVKYLSTLFINARGNAAHMPLNKSKL